MTTNRRTSTRIRRSRSTRRGAAMIEALCTVGLFTCMLGGGSLLRRAYQSKLDLMGRVRAQVWQEAMQGCAAPANQNSLAQTAKSFLNGTPSISDETVLTWFGVPKRSASGSVVVEIPALSSAAQPGANQRNVRVSHSVACNEVPLEDAGVVALFGVFRSLAD